MNSVSIFLAGSSLFLRTASAAPLPAPWTARGDEVQAEDTAYGDRLERFYAALTARFKDEAPDLLARMKEEAPAPVAHGYQLLPKMGPDAAPPVPLPRAEVRSYSWPWTERMIGRETKTLDSLEADLARARTAPVPDRRAPYEKLAADYKALHAAQVLIDVHIQYNRLWQESIAGNRALYDRQTELENAVLERQAARDALAALKCGPGEDRGKCEEPLRGREEALGRKIHAATDEVVPPAFVRVEHPAARRWIVRVPFITDIEDEDFLRSFRSAVENAWRVADGGDEYRVEISTERISTARLYAGSGLPPPKPGDPVDLARHFGLFPPGGAVLTTGAATTHVAGRCIVIGTNEQKPHDLAHEFGHILGFKDVYFRGYKDLGADGFDVQEIIAEPGDIMGAPGWGPVRKEHFTRLIGALAR